ncbi:SH3 domain-containing protein [[Clostridium] dakarense]|uniref:SH3 domain-containing protein n=1 Tax=Faecalimicrobium dakarense TaxID=1301100 RepID=UPI0004B86F00|nr:SH3 domain-containing protein [[Clostridium] dakarense]
MKNKIALATLAMLPIAATNVSASGHIGVVTTSSLNVRSGVGTNNSVIFTIKKGDQVEIKETSDGWYKIRTNSGQEGWSSSEYISTSQIASQESSTGNKKKTTDRVNLRNGAGTSYRVITTLNKGEVLEVVSESNGWAKVKHDGRLGYISSQYLENLGSSSSNVSSTKIVDTDTLNVRSGPSTSNGIVGKLHKGEKVGVISEGNGWSKIKFNSTEAYTSTMYLKAEGQVTVPEKPSKPDTTPEATKETKVVNTSSLNVRNGAGTSNSKIGSLKLGEKVEVISESNGWSKIKFSGSTGYVSSQYLSKINTSPETPEKPSQPETTKETKQVNTSSLNVRSGAGTNNSKIGSLKLGEKIEVISESKGWSKIKFNGSTGYVSSQYLSKVNTSPEIPEKPSQPETPTQAKEVNTSSLNVRSGPGTNYSKVGSLKQGNKVDVISENNGWSKIKFSGKDGFVSSEYLSQEGGSKPENPVPPVVGGDSVQIVDGATVHNKGLIYSLSNHVEKQINVGKNVMNSANAGKNDLEYFLNPNNFRNSKKGMMQFLRLDSYKGGITAGELNSFLNAQRLSSQGTNVFYNQGQAFIDAARKYNIDLVYLVAHSMWETGYGSSTLAQGQVLTSYKGQALSSPVKVYNFFGIGAFDGTANLSGAEAAYANGWTSVEKTIEGSAKWIANNYLKSSKYDQNTVYKMKFYYENPRHQYATDVNWANGISGIMYRLIGMYDTTSNLKYEIPIYQG